MAIRNIAHSIRAGEISLGVAVGVESMSVKSVSSSRRLVLATHGVALQFDSQSVLIFLVYVVPAPLPW
jgi:acetyl-CoA acetyltransferase